MREFFSRLRAALTPQALLLFAALALLFFSMSARRSQPLSLEGRIEETLCAMEGAGQVRVTIRTREVVSSGGAFSARQSESVPCGAVVVAQGADDPLVAIRLQEALCALLALPPSSVSVIAGGK